MYQKLNKLGSGQFGHVYLAKLNNTNKTFAVKNYQKPVINRFRSGDRTEIDFLSRADHPNIIKVHTIYLIEGQVNVVMDLAQTDLEKHLAKEKLTLAQKEKLCAQFISAIQYVHHNGYLHCDLKAENILLIDDQLKLADFGKARHNDNHYEPFSLDPFVSSIAYRAPELLVRETIFRRVQPTYAESTRSIQPTWSTMTKAEYYSIGRVLLDIITNDSRCTVERFTETMKLTFMHHDDRVRVIKTLADGVDSKLIELVASLLSLKPTDRSFPLDPKGPIKMDLPKILHFNIYHPYHLDAIRVGASIVRQLKLKPIEFSQALSMYYNLFPYGLSYLHLLVDQIDSDERVHMTMAASIMLTTQPTSYNAHADSISTFYRNYISEEILAYFSQDAYERMKGVVMYDHIGNYTRQYGAYGTWSACRYYSHESSGVVKQEMADYVEGLSLSQYEVVDCRICDLPRAVYESIF
jgi:serine/threonine protein kinase